MCTEMIERPEGLYGDGAVPGTTNAVQPSDSVARIAAQASIPPAMHPDETGLPSVPFVAAYSGRPTQTSSNSATLSCLRSQRSRRRLDISCESLR